MDDPGSPPPAGPERTTPDGLTEYLTRHLVSLEEILTLIDENPPLIDASLEDVHALAARLAKVMKSQVLRLPGPGDAIRRDIVGPFEQARTNESDNYEIYADDLERHQRRQHRDLAVAESDADKFAIAKRRRSYMASLFDLHQRITDIVAILDNDYDPQKAAPISLTTQLSCQVSRLRDMRQGDPVTVGTPAFTSGA